MNTPSNSPQYNQRKSRQKAFTLIELMVVIVIIGVMAALSTMSVGGNDMRRLKSEAKRLQGLLTLAQDEAIFRQQNFGFYLDEDKYSLLIFNAQSHLWQTSDDDSFQPYPLPAGIEMEILVEGETQQLPIPEEVLENWEDDEDFVEEERLLPQILILSSGEATPFDIFLKLNNGSPLEAQITTDGFSPLTIEMINEAR